MDGCFHGDKLRILLMNRHMSYIVTETIWSAVTIYIGHVPVD